MNNLLQDLRYGIRLLRKSPGFTFIAILTLALGIGANTAIFTVVNGVLLKPLPFTQPDRLVRVFDPAESGQVDAGDFSPQDFDDFVRMSKSYSALAAYEYFPGLTTENLTGVGEPVRLSTAFVSGTFFQVFPVQPLVGRVLAPADDVVGKNNVVVISRRLWHERFSSDPNIAGRKVILEATPYIIAGVLQENMQYPAAEVDIWAPLTLLDENSVPHIRSLRWQRVVGRLKPDVTMAQAHSEANVIMARLAQMYPDSNQTHNRAVVRGLHDVMVGDVRPAVLILFATVAMVLLIACANVANLALARGTGRSREMAIRAALGAHRKRIIQQMLTESVLLSLLGGALGVIFGAWSVQALVALGEGTIPRANSIALDWRVLLFAFAVSLFTGVLFGTIPALRGAGFDFQHAMKDSGYSTSEGQRRRSVRNGLIVGEVAIAAVLLVASILVIKSLWKLTHVDPGFEANNVLTISIRTPQEHQRDRKESVAYRTELLRLVSEVPGVVAVGASKTLPMEAGGEPYSFTYTGGSGVVDIKPDAGVFIVSPDYFKALQIPLIAGRTFTQEDNVVGAPGVLIVNQALANRYWPGESAIGKELRVDKTVIPIVGVVGDVRSEGLAKTPRSAIYGPFGKFPRSALQIYVRTNGNPLSVAGPVREAIWSYEKNQPMEISTLSSISERQVAQPKFFTTLLSGFGGLALLLAAIGIYGVISYNVTRQIREIGIRMALGAQPSQVLSMVLRDALRLTAMGLAIGLLLALLATRALGSLLFGVSANDLASYAVMPLLLTGIALLASYVPARRATKVDPIVALHYE